MTQASRSPRGSASLAALLCALALLAGGPRAGEPTEKAPSPAPPRPARTSRVDNPAKEFVTETLRGKVVWLDEAMQRRYGVVTEPAAAKTAVALETPEGNLIPLALDTRGQAFAVDPRLRDVDLELLVRRYVGSPLAQVIRVRKRTPQGLKELDYWCDICAIRMYILKDCECCQGPTRLREEPVDPADDDAPR
jgi:hypothetical protein